LRNDDQVNAIKKVRSSIGILPHGSLNAITDVQGVRVGHCTIIEDEPVVARTGVTVIQPLAVDYWKQNVFAGFHRYNGFGEVSGVLWIEESGILTSPICLTSTFSLGIVRDTLYRDFMDRGMKGRGMKGRFEIGVVGETNDIFLSDAPKWPVRPEHVLQALNSCTDGPVSEGNVGAGTGTMAYLFKGGIGTASKVAETPSGKFTVGVLVQANHGQRQDLVIDGVPVGREIGHGVIPYPHLTQPDPYLKMPQHIVDRINEFQEEGSIMIVVATDAPLLPVQCKRLAQRAAIGLGRIGGLGNNGSGDFIICFSTANKVAPVPDKAVDGIEMMPNHQMTPMFQATIEATESAILNSMLAAEDITGRNGNKAYALTSEAVENVMSRYGREAPWHK
jgi:D-aminopeptidase